VNEAYTFRIRMNIKIINKTKNQKVSKKEISNFMKNQNKEEPIDTELADALEKLKFDK
jgi:DNA topoisomerase-3